MINWDWDNPYTRAFTVAPEHIDLLNHTNNAVYINWCEQVAWRHSETLGMSVDDFRRLDRAMAIRRSEYDYIAASFLGEELVIGTWLTKAGKIELERRFQVVRRSDGATLLRGLWQLVCIELSSSRPKRLPPEFVGSYGPAVIEM